jgi:para-nitrobenzyl esterase
MADDLALAPVARTDVVQTSNGPVRGYVEDGLAVFKGLSYGASPEGLQRFKPPKGPRPGPKPPTP